MKTYTAKGMVIGNCWGGGVGSYTSSVLSSKSKKALLEIANTMLRDGSLDGGMGFESLIGAILSVKEIDTKLINGKEYVYTNIYDEYIGKVDDEWVDTYYECY